MKITRYFGWRVKLGILLVILAALLYIIDVFIFHDLQHILFYIGIDIAFLPIEVLLVVLVIESAISAREKKVMMEKLNMVIGVFYSDVGTKLLSRITKFDAKNHIITKELLVTSQWSNKDFRDTSKHIKNYDYNLKDLGHDNESLEFLESLKIFLSEKRKFLLTLLENPNLLEHESFTDLLWAVFHMMEELENRVDLRNLSDSDYQHLKGDLERAYSLLIYEWLHYMEHLLNNYPYLFSLAMRMNPFDPDAHAEISD